MPNTDAPSRHAEYDARRLPTAPAKVELPASWLRAQVGISSSEMSRSMQCTRIELPVRDVRHRLGLSTREFAYNLSGVCGRRWSQSQIARIETGARKASPELLADIRALALSRMAQR